MASIELATKTLRFDRGGIDVEGCNAARFTYPRIASPRFASPLLNDRNYELSGGGPWRDVIGQVTARRKPVGFVDSSQPRNLEEYAQIPELLDDPMRAAAWTALDAGCSVLLYTVTWDDQEEPTTFCSASINGRIGEVLDVEALIADYRDYTAVGAPQISERIAEELRALESADVSEFLQFEMIEGDTRAPSPGDWARRGLLFGYPVETTVAMICGDVGIDGCGVQYID
jgi:hypothetical protein